MNAEQLYSRGAKHLEFGELDEAETLLKQVLSMEPNHGRALNKLGVASIQREAKDRARAYFEAALEAVPDLAEAHSNLGNIHQQEGEDQAAEQCYLQAIQANPDYPTAYHNLGVLYRQSGRISDGVRYIKKAKQLERRSLLEGTDDRPKTIPWTILLWLAAALIGALLLFT